MNKHYLLSTTKSTGTAYLCWFFFGCHYAYLGKWGLQILYWCTLGGMGFWAFVDLFTMSSKVNNHNMLIMQQVDEIEKRERAENLAMMRAVSGERTTIITPSAQETTKQTATNDQDKMEKLKKLKGLLDSGILTQEEYNEQKKIILDM